MTLLFLIGLLLNPYGLAYATVFRGYLLQALLVLMAFLYYYKHSNALSFKHYLILDLLFCLNTAHLMSSLYLWAPFKIALLMTYCARRACYQQLAAGAEASLYFPHFNMPFHQQGLQLCCLALVILNTSYQSIFNTDPIQFFNINRENISDLLKEEAALTTLFKTQHTLLCQEPGYLDKNLRLLYLYEYQYHCDLKLSLNQVHQFYKDDHLAQKNILLSAEHFPLHIPTDYQLVARQSPYDLYLKKE